MSMVKMTGLKEYRVNVHALLPRSRCNGPGLRAVIWVQGCVFQCPGCFNSAARDPEAGTLRGIVDIFQSVFSSEIEGITLSGGEPFCQAGPVSRLVQLAQTAGLSVMVYSGYTLAQLKALKKPGVQELLAQTDILVDGLYRRDIPPRHPWTGSGNQQVIFLSPRYRHLEEKQTESGRFREIQITSKGEVLFTGF